MRRAAIVLIAVMMCTGYSVGQSNGLPQWKVVKEFHVTGRTTPIPPTVIFTPRKNGLYRFSLLGLGSGPANGAYCDMSISWTDLTRTIVRAELYVCTGSVPSQDIIHTFAPLAGTNVVFSVQLSDPPPNNPYDLAVTIEQLTH